MKLLLNCLLYAAQWLHLRMGGEVEVSRDRISLLAPKGRHWCASESAVEARLKDMEAAKTASNSTKVVICPECGAKYCVNVAFGQLECGCGEWVNWAN
jgi:hypothetical protein